LLPKPADCRRALDELINHRIIALRESEERLRIERDIPDRAEAADRALILADDREARRFLRYHSESRIAFQRAYSELVKTLERDASEPIETAPDVTPNEANSVELQETVSPNEPISCARPEPAIEPVAIE